MVRFQRHNMLSEPFERGFDLICGRNVTIYFTDDAKYKLNQQFHSSLNNGGILFIGAAESIPEAKAIGFKKLGDCFYQKIAVPVSFYQIGEEPLLKTTRR